MVKVKNDLTGMVFGRLTVIKQVEDYVSPKGEHKAQWLCECNCSEKNKVIVYGCHLKRGNTNSCGCLIKENITEIGYSKWKGNNYQLNLEDEYGLYGIGYCTNTGREFYFDMDDYDKIKDYSWCEIVTTNGYHAVTAYDKNDKQNKRLFWIVAGKYYDHHDRDPFNNRKYNLLEATVQENTRNATKRKDNTTGFIGVCWHKQQCKWHVTIRENGKRKHIGSFINKEDAIRARLQAEAKYYGEFAPQRHLFEEYGIIVNNST